MKETHLSFWHPPVNFYYRKGERTMSKAATKRNLKQTKRQKPAKDNQKLSPITPSDSKETASNGSQTTSLTEATKPEPDEQSTEPTNVYDSLPLTPEEDDQLDDVLVELEEQFDEPEGLFPQTDDEDEEWLEQLDSSTPLQDENALSPASGDTSVIRIADHAKEQVGGSPTGTLIAHSGTRKIAREELMMLAIPEGTRTHQPIAHHAIVKALVESLAFRHITVVREEYAVSPDGGKMFGVLDLDAEWNNVRFSIGVRNSNDKSMRLGMTVGYRVMVCDNMMFKGDFAPIFHKHTRKLDLLDVISVGVDRMQRGFAPLKTQIQSWQNHPLTDEQAKLLIYRAFLEDRFPKTIMADVHRRYFEPQHEAFAGRTLWSLSNAFTSAFKRLTPMSQFSVTARLGGYLEQQMKAEDSNAVRHTPADQSEQLRAA